jgi:hypothetical protein
MNLAQRIGSTALGTYAAYVAHGLRHPSLLRSNGGRHAARWLRGDDLVDDPDWQTTFAVAIEGGRQDVWPWIVQLGWGRAGWYTWYRWDNGGVPSAERIVPELQHLRVGDVIPDGPRAAEGFGVWRVVALEPNRALVLHSHRDLLSGREIGPGDSDRGSSIDCSWAFVVEQIDARRTRLLVRVRARFEGAATGRIAAKLARLVFGFGDTVMERTLLEGIKERVERARFAPA